MELKEKLELIAETIDADLEAVKAEVELKSLEEWDSMGVISVITMLDRKFSKVLTADEISELKTIQDILNLMA